MCFTDLVLHAHLIGDRIFAIGIIADQHLSAHTRGNRLNPGFECLAIFGAERINREVKILAQTTRVGTPDAVSKAAVPLPEPRLGAMQGVANRTGAKHHFRKETSL